MLCYRDRTYCGAKDCARFGNSCERSLTPDIAARVKSVGLPISQFSHPKELECYNPKKVNKGKEA